MSSTLDENYLNEDISPRIKLEWMHWLKTEWQAYIVFFLIGLTLLALTVWKIWAIIVLFPYILFCRKIVLRDQEHFEHGVINAGICLAHTPGTQSYLIGVLADLSMTEDDRLLFHIFESNVPDLKAYQLKAGDRVACSCLYKIGSDSLPYFTDVDAKPLQKAISSYEELQELSSRELDESEWQEMLEVAKQISKPYSPGLYPIGWTL